ncbi:hypothetical protein Poly59_54710 [Rubripirellula reticaptiva]|uniref:PIN domain-containing protein n=1 Tax=Rubripirellula reticaptiva TaxID=2528013 RepID=A0A5C6EC80_9BACT|nr:hypothetical protein Poly59_54710 [Rubripirellula reticaptiva]
MSWPPGNQILIDTNVFKHLCDKNAKYNPDGNVDNLLSRLLTSGCRLIVDDQNLFREEFERIVAPQFEREFETEREVYLLRYWADIGNQDEQEIKKNQDLIKAIRRVIIENERTDIAYVYLAFTHGRVLVSNDGNHIVLGPPAKQPRDGDRRTRLRKYAKRHMKKGCAVLFSYEANACLEPI